MSAWIVEVKIRVHTPTSTTEEWQAVHPTGGDRYEFPTRHEAEAMLRICYPDQTRDEARTREVTP